MSRRYENFDVLRGLAIIGVVLIHITAPLATDGDLVAVVVNQMSRFAVPVFFILSGWGLTISNSLERSDSYWNFLKVRFLSILPQYLLWNIVYLFYSGVWEVYQGFSLEVLGDLLNEIFLGTIYNHLYFVPIILIFYILYPLLLRISNQYGVLVSLVVTLISQLSDIWIEHEYFYMNKNVFNWLFYFMFGIWLAKNFEKKVYRMQKYKIPIFMGLIVSMVMVILTPFTIGEVFDYNLALASTRPTVIFYSIMLLLLVMVVKMDRSSWRGILLKLSQYSFYIYLNHYLFVGLWRDFYGAIGLALPSGVFIGLSFVVIVAVSYGVGVLTRGLEQRFGT